MNNLSYFSVVSPEDSVMVDRPTVLTNFNSTEIITCTADGGPDNMFEWRKQGPALVITRNSILELTMITGSDGGVYECTVTNDAGSDMNSTSVIGMYYIINFLLLIFLV